MPLLLAYRVSFHAEVSDSISSDNTTYFIGANNELRQLSKQVKSLEQSKRIEDYL